MAIRNTGEKIRVFIGTEPKTEIARKVLETSINRHTDMKVEFTAMIGPEWEYPLDGIKVGTGFSLRRWMIPAFCGWQGRAIYCDADQLAFGDFWDLWTKPEQIPDRSACVWCTYQVDKFSTKTPWPQTSVMVIDCERAKGLWGFKIDDVLYHLFKRNTVQDYANFMHGTWLPAPGPVRIETEWNHLNEYKEGRTKILHYTKEPEQPWYRPDHPLAQLWKLELSIALNVGAVTDEMMKEALRKWNVQEDWRHTNGLHPDYSRFLVREKRFLKELAQEKFDGPKPSRHDQGAGGT